MLDSLAEIMEVTQAEAVATRLSDRLGMEPAERKREISLPAMLGATVEYPCGPGFVAGEYTCVSGPMLEGAFYGRWSLSRDCAPRDCGRRHKVQSSDEEQFDVRTHYCL